MSLLTEPFAFSELPWLHDDYNFLIDRYISGKSPQALLITGIEGIGKWNIASELTKKILCSEPSGNYVCGICQSCRWMASYHPDLKIINQEKEEIRVDTVRALSSFAAITSETGRKVVIIHYAEMMNIHAANCLLKILEEPPKNFYFILTAHRYERLPATVLSRCQRHNLFISNREIIYSWLQPQVPAYTESQLRELIQVASNAPIKAYHYCHDQFFEQYELIEKTFLACLNREGDLQKHVDILLLHRELVFALFCHWLRTSIYLSDNKLPKRQILSRLCQFPRQFLLTKINKLIEIQFQVPTQLKYEWLFMSWLSEFARS